MKLLDRTKAEPNGTGHEIRHRTTIQAQRQSPGGCLDAGLRSRAGGDFALGGDRHPHGKADDPARLRDDHGVHLLAVHVRQSEKPGFSKKPGFCERRMKTSTGRTRLPDVAVNSFKTRLRLFLIFQSQGKDSPPEGFEINCQRIAREDGETGHMRQPASLRTLLKRVHNDQRGAVTLETILIIAAIALPILIFLIKYGWPKIRNYFDKGLRDLEDETNQMNNSG